jgi:hypothetical protein
MSAASGIPPSEGRELRQMRRWALNFKAAASVEMGQGIRKDSAYCGRSTQNPYESVKRIYWATPSRVWK